MWRIRPMQLQLAIPDVSSAARRFGPFDLPAVLGRGDAATIRLQDPWVSRCHCRVEERNGQAVLIDLGAKHGTFVNGERVKEAILQVGDIIGAGITTLHVDHILTSGGVLTGYRERHELTAMNNKVRTWISPDECANDGIAAGPL
jgi:pSer/pThr/pTyr-binding forkhead associated (FHA) protein